MSARRDVVSFVLPLCRSLKNFFRYHFFFFTGFLYDEVVTIFDIVIIFHCLAVTVTIANKPGTIGPQINE
jgi:hypothetical protein